MTQPDPSLDLSDVPEATRDLIDLSKEYLRQETLVPAQRLGRFGGFSIGAAAVFAFGAIFYSVGLLQLAQINAPEGDWFLVLASGLAALVVLITAGIIAWRGFR